MSKTIDLMAVTYGDVVSSAWLLSPYFHGGRSLRPVKNGGESFVKGVGQNFSLPIFYWWQ